MRDISVLIHRLQAGLPITHEEREAIREHIMRHNKSNDRFNFRFTAFVVVASLAVFAFKYFGG